MNTLDERLERPAKCPGRKTVMGLDGFRPLENAGGVVHVPDPDVRRLQRIARPLFARAQCLHRLMTVGDVGARTERADDASFVIVQEPVPPLNETFLARPGEDGALDDGQISVEQVTELRSEIV